ncbi:MAG: 4Fe-4S dicluster domain-containing protein [Rubrobacteraceae bacterium]|jgi:ferredoxin
MTNYGFIIDNRKCIGCHACTVACKAEHEVPVGVNRTWVKYIEKGEFPDTQRAFHVMRCNHCEDAPCVEACPVTALYFRDDGIVDFNCMHCWHNAVYVEKAKPDDEYGDVYVDMEKSRAVYKKWLSTAHPGLMPDGLRRPEVFDRPYRPDRESFFVKE